MSVFYGDLYHCDNPHDVITSVQGHDVVADLDGYGYCGNTPGLFAITNQSWKETTIVHNGAVVQNEKYVYTGLTNGEPAFDLIEIVVRYNDSLGHATNLTRIDPVTSAQRIIYTADWKGTNQSEADLKFSEMDEDGIELIYSYDSLKRLKTSTKSGPTNI